MLLDPVCENQNQGRVEMGKPFLVGPITSIRRAS